MMVRSVRSFAVFAAMVALLFTGAVFAGVPSTSDVSEVGGSVVGGSEEVHGVSSVSVSESLLPGGGEVLRVTHDDGAVVRTSTSMSHPFGFVHDPVRMGTSLVVDTGMPSTTVFGNLTVVATRSNGVTTAYPCDVARPTTSNNNYVANVWALPNFVAVSTDADGFACFHTSGDAELLWDQYGSATDVGVSPPVRRFDTRDTGRKVQGGDVYVFRTGVPHAVLLGNVTVTGTEGSGFTTVYPCLSGRPNASTNNFGASETVPNFAVVKADAAGDVCFYTTTTTHLLFDEAARVAGGSLEAHAPVRLLDTRESGGAVPAGGVVVVETGVPNTTILGNLTVTGPQRHGITTLWDCEGPVPVASTNNYLPNQTIPNFAAVRTNDEGQFCVFSSAQTHVVWDSSSENTVFDVGNPERLLDTRLWGSGAGGGDDTHWSVLYSDPDTGQAVKWDECSARIPVLVNPARGGDTQISAIVDAVEKVRATTGLPLVYAGETTTEPSRDNVYGYVEHRNENAIVVAFTDRATNPIVPPGAAAVGGFVYLDSSARSVYGYVAVDVAGLVYSREVLVALYMHELGHVIGLGHFNDALQVMSPTLYNTSGQWGRGDLHGLSFLGRATGRGCS